MLTNNTPDNADYGTLGQDSNIETSNSSETELDDVYAEIGLGPAQYTAWSAVALMGYSDFAELTVLSVVMLELRCEWDLSSGFEAAIAISMYTAYAAAAMLFGKVADVYGRKYVVLISTIILLAATIGSVSAQDKWFFLVCRIVAGACIGINWTTDMCYATEFSESKYRTIGVAVGFLSSIFGGLVIYTVAFAVLNIIGWRMFVVIVSLPLLPTIAILLWLPDSPRYLCVSGKMDKAVKAVKFLARLNGKTLPDDLQVKCFEHEDLGSFMTLLSHENIRTTLTLSSIFFTTVYVSFGTIAFLPLMFETGYCGANVQPPIHECGLLTQRDLLKMTIVPTVSLVTVVFFTFIANTFGRLTPLRVASGLQIIAVALLFVCMPDPAKVAVAASGGACIIIVVLMLWIIVPESYPTNIRSSAIGFINGWGRIGGCMGTGSVYLWLYVNPDAVLGLFVGMSILGFLFTFILNRETKDVVVRDT